MSKKCILQIEKKMTAVGSSHLRWVIFNKLKVIFMNAMNFDP